MEINWYYIQKKSKCLDLYNFGKEAYKILLPSARHLKERLTVSQSVGQAGRQTGRQKHKVGVLFSRGLHLQTVGNIVVMEQSAVKW